MLGASSGSAPTFRLHQAHASFSLLYLRSITQMEPGGMQEDMKECPVHGDRVKVERPDNYETAHALPHKGAAHEAAETEVTHEKQASIADLISPYGLSSGYADSVLPSCHVMPFLVCNWEGGGGAPAGRRPAVP